MLSFAVKEEQKDIKSADAAGLGGALGGGQESMTLYTCANCTRIVALSPSSQLMCTHCVHRTGSSTVFYKLRTQPTTSLAMLNRPPKPQLQTTAGGARSAPTPQCVCASCFSSLMLPRPDATGTPFQCPQCRVSSVDMKVLYTKRAFPTEHSTN